MDITHDNVCSSMLSCFYSHLLSTGRPISSSAEFLFQKKSISLFCKCKVICQFFQKIYLPILYVQSHLSVSSKNLSPLFCMCKVICQFFQKKISLPIFGSHLEFLRKMQTCFYLKQNEIEQFQINFWSGRFI